MKYPSEEYRLLATFRLWNVFHYFFPYRELTGEDWDAALLSFIRKAMAAQNETEYALAMAEMAARTHDSHVGVYGEAMDRFLGAAPPPLAVRIIEGLPVITQVIEVPETKAAGITPGDVVISVDGEDALRRMKRLAPYLAASTPQSLDWKLAGRLLTGADGSEAKVVLRDARDQTREISLPRKQSYQGQLRHPRTGDVYKVLPGNIGYADLDRLTVAQVDAMLEALKGTKAIIFDMRGYPNGTAWSIAPRLTEKTKVSAARFDRPVLLSPSPSIGSEGGVEWAVNSFLQPIPTTDKWRYKRPTLMLIDERTISQSEHTGLFFEAANGTKFIGTPTAGANGDVTRFSLPVVSP